MSETSQLTSREEQNRRLVETLKRQLGTIYPVLVEPGVIEVLLNPDGSIWVERLGKPMERFGTPNATTAESFIGTVAASLRSAVNRENPILECELPIAGGARFEALVPPVVVAPTFTIRLKASAVFTLADYERQGIMSPRHRVVIERAIGDRKNILVVGGTGSGKTTLMNALIEEMARATPEHRLVIIEDTGELQCTAENFAILRSSDCVSMQRLLKATMRLRPDRIIIGEVRGGEALAMLKAWNTGHPGGAGTLHSNTQGSNAARSGLVRLEQLIAEASQTPMHALIAEAVDLIVSIEKAPGVGRRIRQVVSVDGHDGHSYQLTDVE